MRDSYNWKIFECQTKANDHTNRDDESMIVCKFFKLSLSLLLFA